ncbi:MAG: sulfite exporter TauE/SafE family protein, partial [Firmicutes bacterium]|nr:sulfite exporter TauE/SafE family protein [Bacillota bacterium]
MLTNVGIAAIALGASLLQSVSGFGFGIVFMALTPLFIPYTISVGISTILSGTLNLVILKRCWRDIDWKQLWLPVLFCLCGSSIGTFMMATAPSPIYKR